MIYLIVNKENGYEFETKLSEPLILPEDLSNQESSLWEELCEYLRSTVLENAEAKIGSTPCGIFDNADEIGNSIYTLCDELVHRHIDNKLTYVELDDNRNIVKQIPLTLPSELYLLGRDYEQFAIETGYTIISMLTEFLNKGKWHCGLMNGYTIITDSQLMPSPIIKNSIPTWQDTDGNEMTPIIWFGLENEKPIQIWSLIDNESTFFKRNVWDYNKSHTNPVDKSDWQSFWFCGFWYMDWNALFGGYDDYYTVWMFCECGMDEPTKEFDAVRNSCPIKLDENDSDEMLAQKIYDYFIKLTDK